MKKIVLFITLFLIFSSLSYLTLAYEKNDQINTYLQTTTKQYSQNYSVVYNEYKLLSQMIYDTRINTDKVQSIFQRATIGTLQDKNKAREELYNHLQKVYNRLKIYKVKQLHFHLPNNDSFLRFHRPNRYGDNLSGIRETVEYVNKYHKPIDGFEEGRIYNGYRFVFPLFSKNVYLGSVEISFSSLAMNMKFMQDYDVTSNFLISKNVIEKKVFKDELDNYMPSPIKGYYLEKNMIQKIRKVRNLKKTIQPLAKETIKTLIQEEDGTHSFSLYDHVRKDVMTFIKVLNPITKKPVAIFVVRSDATYLFNKTDNFYIFVVLVNLFIGFILFYFYKATLYKNKIEQSNKKLQESQKNILALNQTLEKKVETQVQNIRESNLVHETIFNTVKDGIAILDLDSNFILVNDAYEKMTGYTKEELYEKSCISMTIPSMVEESQRVFSKAIDKGFYESYRKRCLNRDEKELEVIMDILLMPDQKHLLIAIKDITVENQLKRTQMIQERHLLQQSRFAQMGEMISMIAHQWRQPLSSISATASNLKIRLDLGLFDLSTEDGREEHKVYFTERINSINTYVQNLSSTIDDFRDFYKPNKKSVEVSLKHVIDKALHIVEASLVNHNVQLIFDYNSDYIFELYDNEMMQVILNIIKNAQDNFIERGIEERKITIATNKNSISISDNGGGINENIIEKVFDPYFSTKDEKNGTGIGLYMSKIIIQDHHHGLLQVENLNDGVCFTIVLNKRLQDKI